MNNTIIADLIFGGISCDDLGGYLIEMRGGVTVEEAQVEQGTRQEPQCVDVRLYDALPATHFSCLQIISYTGGIVGGSTEKC